MIAIFRVLRLKPCMCFADQADQCDPDSFAMVTASLVNDVHSLLTSLTGGTQLLLLPQIPSEAIQAIKNVNADSIVLMAHSAGAVTAVDMLAGKPACCLLHLFCGHGSRYNELACAVHC